MISIYKKIIDLLFYPCILILLLSLALSDNPPGWHTQTIPTNKPVKDIFFIDSLKGWIVASSGLVYDSSKIIGTIDGGNTWTIQYNRDTTILNEIQFIDRNTGYCVGGYLKILKSTNGGINWYQLSNVPGANYFTSLYFVNADTGWVGDETAGGIYRTTNAGQNWAQQSPWGVTKINFINENTGWFASGEKLFKTTNAGINWNLLNTFAGFINIFFVNNDTGWVTGGGNTNIMKTTNGGMNWISQDNPGEGYTFQISFIKNNKLWIGSRFNKMLATTDGGDFWGYQFTPTFQNNNVFFIDSLNGWGGNPLLIHTTDGGGPITYVGINELNNNYPDKFILYQNYPNPFNPNTVIKYELRIRSYIELKVYNVQGKELKTFINQRQDAGEYKFKFDANDLPSGIYFYQINVTDEKGNYFTQTNKMILTK